jgi:hypothetical protein
MALNFGTGASSPRVDCGSGASIDNINVGTWMAWVYPTSSVNCRLMQKGLGPAGHIFYTTTTVFEMTIARGTQSLLANASLANCAAYGTNKHVCMAAVFDTGGAAGDQKIYMGDLATPLAEPSAYTTQRIGSGAVGDDSGVNLIIGNISSATLSYPGDVSWIAAWNRRLSHEELIAQQWHPHVTSGCVGFWVLGYNGTGTQPDWSGNGNNGSVTGATVAAHVPLRSLYGGFAGWRGVNRAATTYTITPSGLLVPVGALANSTSKALAGSVTPSGAAAKLADKAASGSIGSAGAIVHQANKGLSGTLAPSGAATKAVSARYSGALTPTGALTLIRAILMTVSGAITPAGALVRTVGKGVTGTLPSVGAIVKDTAAVLRGSITPTGALGKLIGKFWSGLVGLVGSLTTGSVAAAQPNVIAISGTYIPTLSTTGSYVATVTASGSYLPTVSITGEADLS